MCGSSPQRPPTERDIDLCSNIPRTVARAAGIAPADLPPLYHVIDVESIDRVLDRPSGGPDRSDEYVAFPYHDYQVVVPATGLITVAPVDGATLPRPVGHSFEWERSEQLAGTIANAVAVATDRDPDSLQPLYDTVDPEAIESIVVPERPTSAASGERIVQFRYQGCLVRVDAAGDLYVGADPDADPTGRSG